jgi:hypothetical protein
MSAFCKEVPPTSVQKTGGACECAVGPRDDSDDVRPGRVCRGLSDSVRMRAGMRGRRGWLGGLPLWMLLLREYEGTGNIQSSVLQMMSRARARARAGHASVQSSARSILSGNSQSSRTLLCCRRCPNAPSPWCTDSESVQQRLQRFGADLIWGAAAPEPPSPHGSSV